MDNFELANAMNGMCMPKNIANLDEILHGVNELAWIKQGLTYAEWFKRTVKYKSTLPDDK